ncbi:MAG: 4Fe-4S binding protein [Magnetococcales bacterium]|nr:4Fe-4S binding protein [Magnetococcales bacterium]
MPFWDSDNETRSSAPESETGSANRHDRRQRLRRWSQRLFFLLFLTAPSLDLLRLDLVETHGLIFLGQERSLGLGALVASSGTPALEIARTVLLGVILPVTVLAIALLWIAYHYGRLYCGWLCPHFSVVEWVNHWMQRASGRPTLHESRPQPHAPWIRNPTPPNPWAWAIALGLALLMALVWAVSLLTYLVPPTRVFAALWHGTLSTHELLFIGVATLLFTIDFLFARHLFCRFGCAIGLAQSLAWMGNPAALAPDFRRQRVAECHGCPQACEAVCPMRLRPRGGKKALATCTQCGQCLRACAHVQAPHARPPLLTWVRGRRS